MNERAQSDAVPPGGSQVEHLQLVLVRVELALKPFQEIMTVPDVVCKTEKFMIQNLEKIIRASFFLANVITAETKQRSSNKHDSSSLELTIFSALLFRHFDDFVEIFLVPTVVLVAHLTRRKVTKVHVWIPVRKHGFVQKGILTQESFSPQLSFQQQQHQTHFPTLFLPRTTNLVFGSIV